MSHEDLSREAEVEEASPRSFGVVFALAFAVIAFLPLLSKQPVRLWALPVAIAMAIVALAVPQWLAVPSRWWSKFGQLIGRIVSPVVTAILFFAVVTPFGWLVRRFRKDALRLALDPAASTYWIDRSPPGPDPATMNRQF